MSSFKNASKSCQKTHKERAQPANRAHLGHLEKKKDYKRRAQEYKKKDTTYKLLRQKALDKNPDEFYFHMVNSELKDGKHFEKVKEEELNPEQVKLMKTQDQRYIHMKWISEAKKIDRLKSRNHLLDVEKHPLNAHTFFVDDEKQAKKFNIAKHLDTHPALLSRAYNRPLLKTLKSGQVITTSDVDKMKEVAKDRKKLHKELLKRIERERGLYTIAQKMQVQKQLLDDNKACVMEEPESMHAPAVYRWAKERKK